MPSFLLYLKFLFNMLKKLVLVTQKKGINVVCFGHYVPIIRRNNCVCATFGAFYSLWSGPGSVVGIATAYELDGLGIEFR
jgi:hypothetical protein